MSNPVNFISGRLIKRYKRFFADVKLDSGEVVTAHCPNTGSMMGLLTEGNIVYLSKTDNEKRKLKYTCLLYTSPSPRDKRQSRMPSSA